jgi:hypothetical protein
MLRKPLAMAFFGFEKENMVVLWDLWNSVSTHN